MSRSKMVFDSLKDKEWRVVYSTDFSHIRLSSSKLKLFSHLIEKLTKFYALARAKFGGLKKLK